MTFVLNDPADFTDELTEGFVAAYSELVMAVRGGVVRAAAVPDGQVAIVIGGGSGHYPAFAGLVGPGLAHGAAMGNVFASPSAQQVYNVARSAQTGGGVLLTYGNYAGDVLNFDQAQERLVAEGIPCRTVVVTDDVASAPPHETHLRRGIAGDLVVFKVAAAASQEGRSLEEVADVAARANAATRTLGVAFSGCTLPGADEPLFTVPHGRMGVGMGIHGEPGIEERDIPAADDLAQLLVERLLAERPAGAGDTAVVLLNGLGGVKYEELFVAYRAVARLLHEAGIKVLEPEVGELVTSFQMAGVSLTLAWVDEDLARYWRAPAYTPAYRKGNIEAGVRRSGSARQLALSTSVAEASSGSRAAAASVVRAIETMSTTLDQHVDYLGKLDAVAGDGDHGIGMQRGARAALAAVQERARAGGGAGSVLEAAADAWADRAGGTSGALWGVLLRRIAAALGDQDAPNVQVLAHGMRDGVEEVQSFGKARLGDKTMVDALVPFADAFMDASDAGTALGQALRSAADAAESAARASADLLPKKGRARPHAEKSVGTPDPGAMSFALLASALATTATSTHDE